MRATFSLSLLEHSLASCPLHRRQFSVTTEAWGVLSSWFMEIEFCRMLLEVL